MSSLEQAELLKARVHKALVAMEDGKAHQDYDESEVQFRHDAIVGMLVMASNDVARLVAAWKPSLWV